MKNSLSKDIGNLIKQLDNIEKKHGVMTTPDDMPTELDKVIKCLQQAREILITANIDAIIDEVMNEAK